MPHKCYSLEDVPISAPHIEHGNVRTYDILNDICIKHALVFFGKDRYEEARNKICDTVFSLMQQERKKEAEDWIWANCWFSKGKQND